MSSALDLLSDAALALQQEHIQEQAGNAEALEAAGDETEDDQDFAKQYAQRAQALDKPAHVPHEVPEDSGIIRCLCELDEDDGFTIQCEWCNVWQHATCVEIDTENVPEIYLCNLCDPQGAKERGVDPAKAKLQQKHRLAQEQHSAAAAAAAAALQQRPPPRRPSNSDNRRSASASESNKKRGPGRPPNRSTSAKQPSVPPATTTPATTPGLHQPIFDQPASTTPAGLPPIPSTTPLAEEPSQFDDDADEDAKLESWQYEYTPIERDMYRSDATVDRLAALLESEDGERIKDALDKLRKEQSASVKMNAAVRNLFSVLYDPVPVIFKTTPEPLPTAVKPVAPPATSLAPPNASLYVPTSTSQAATCPYPRPTSYGLFASLPIAAGDYIAPITGQILDLDTYRSSPFNQYVELGVTKPAVRAVPFPYSLSIDQRMFGNETRFVRTGCHPNAIVRPVRVLETEPKVEGSHWSDQRRASAKLAGLSFGLFALTEIGKRDEIVLPWDFDDAHIAHSLPLLMSPSAPALSSAPAEFLEALARKMANVATTMLGLTNCACEKKRDCAIYWLTKAGHVSMPPAASVNARAAQLQRREPFATLLLNALNVGAEGKQTSSAASRRRGAAAAKKPELGVFVGLVRGWLLAPGEPSHRNVQAEDDVEMKDVEVGGTRTPLPTIAERAAATHVTSPISETPTVSIRSNDTPLQTEDGDSDATEPLASDDEEDGQDGRGTSVKPSKSSSALKRNRKGLAGGRKSLKEVGPKRKALGGKRKKGRESMAESERPVSKKVRVDEPTIDEDDTLETSAQNDELVREDESGASKSNAAPTDKKKDPAKRRNVIVKKRNVDAGKKDPSSRPIAPAPVSRKDSSRIKSSSPVPREEPRPVPQGDAGAIQKELSSELFPAVDRQQTELKQASDLTAQQTSPQVPVRSAPTADEVAPSTEQVPPVSDTPVPAGKEESETPKVEEPATAPPEPEKPKEPARARLSLAAYRQRQAQKPSEPDSATNAPGADRSNDASLQQQQTATYPSLANAQSGSMQVSYPSLGAYGQNDGNAPGVSSRPLPSAEDLLKTLGDYFSTAGPPPQPASDARKVSSETPAAQPEMASVERRTSGSELERRTSYGSTVPHSSYAMPYQYGNAQPPLSPEQGRDRPTSSSGEPPQPREERPVSSHGESAPYDNRYRPNPGWSRPPSGLPTGPRFPSSYRPGEQPPQQSPPAFNSPASSAPPYASSSYTPSAAAIPPNQPRPYASPYSQQPKGPAWYEPSPSRFDAGRGRGFGRGGPPPPRGGFNPGWRGRGGPPPRGRGR